MAWRKQEQHQAGRQEDAQTFSWTAAEHDDLDDILGEIDQVLEVNAEEFVKSFVQKGGQ